MSIALKDVKDEDRWVLPAVKDKKVIGKLSLPDTPAFREVRTWLNTKTTGEYEVWVDATESCIYAQFENKIDTAGWLTLTFLMDQGIAK